MIFGRVVGRYIKNCLIKTERLLDSVKKSFIIYMKIPAWKKFCIFKEQNL